MTATPLTHAVLLLTAHFGKSSADDPRPLTPSEWGRFAAWLQARDLAPDALLLDDPRRVLADWRDDGIRLERVEWLLRRSGALGLALEKWERGGLWVLTRGDAGYPPRLKRWLKLEAPPVLFGCGDWALLDRGGLAVVGSRHASPDDLDYAAQLGAHAAQQSLNVISGGARGVDEAAVLGALGAHGSGAVMLADGLLRAATSAKYRGALMAQRLVLASPFQPEAGFAVGNAMARNKYVYCLADAAVVVATEHQQGGTWAGAVENLRHGWVPVWVWPNATLQPGAAALVARGARWLPDGDVCLKDLINSGEARQPQLFQDDPSLSG